MDQSLELVVIEGRKKDATIALPLGATTTVGLGYNCDVVLDLPALYQNLPQQSVDNLPVVELHNDLNRITVSILSGDVTIDGQTASAGMAGQLNLDTAVCIDGNTFIVRACTVDSVSSTELARRPARSIENTERHELPPTRTKESIFAGAAQVCGGFFIIAGALLAHKYTQAPEPVAMTDIATGVETNLLSNGFDELNVVLNEDHTIAVNGYLDNRADLYRAKSQIQVPDLVQWEVKTGESLAESVGSVYRVNGVSAEVEVLGEGSVAVNTATNNLDLLKRVEESVYADVSELHALELVNVPPEKPVEEKPKNKFEELPGKRVVMIVASDPTYVLTEDGSRYFEGSILPSGHMIMAILDKKIRLQLDEDEVELTF